MRPTGRVGLLLIAAGVLALAYQSVSYEQIGRAGERTEPVPLPLLLGAVVVAAGIVIVLVGMHRQAQSSPGVARERLSRGLTNPSAVFSSPEELLKHAQLSRAEKIDLLQRWEYEVIERQVADEEGMVGPNRADVLQRISMARQRLTDGAEIDMPSPTKHHAHARQPRSDCGKGA